MESRIHFKRLRDSIQDMIAEQQLKLGYTKDSVQLFYPLQSLARLLNEPISAEGMQSLLQVFINDSETKALGPISVDRIGDMFRFSLTGMAQEYVHGMIGEYGFLKELIDRISSHKTTMNEIIALCKGWSEETVVEKKRNADFDVLIYFANQKPDRYWYCFSEEGEHVIYHRFTQEDYKDFYPEDEAEKEITEI